MLRWVGWNFNSISAKNGIVSAQKLILQESLAEEAHFWSDGTIPFSELLLSKALKLFLALTQNVGKKLLNFTVGSQTMH